MNAARAERGARHSASGAKPAAAAPSDGATVVAAALLVLAIVGAAIVVDVRAAAAFDAPKRLLAMLGLAGAAGCLLARGAMSRGGTPTVRPALMSGQRLVLGALGLALAGGIGATLASPHAAIARDGLRTLAIFAVALPLGASRVLADGRSAWLLVAFFAAAALNALASLLQVGGVELFATTAITGRTDAGAFLGNEGHLAQVMGLALVAAVVVGWRASMFTAPASMRTAPAPAGRLRGLAIAASVLCFVALVATRNLTALATAAGGVGLAALLVRGRRALVPIALATLVLVAGMLVSPPMRGRLLDAGRSLGSGDWDALTTYRLGPWSAAVEMVRERPLTGFGPGTFGAEFAAHRLQAELRQHRRLVIPVLTSSFAEAHSEYLQAAADGGLLTAGAVLVAAAALLASLARVARVAGDPYADEALLIVAVLGAAAVMALTWFPFQRPVTVVPLLLAAGRGWRLLGQAGVPATPRGGHRALAVVGLVVLAVAMGPELGRYAAERRLAIVTATLERMAAGGRVVPEARPRLTELATIASATAQAMPEDTRGLVAAGMAMLLAGQGADARGYYRQALARGERAEIDLNLARAYALDGRRDDAEAALLRAAWLSPTLLEALPSADRPRLAAALAYLETRLRRGELMAPPPLPQEGEPLPAVATPLPTADE